MRPQRAAADQAGEQGVAMLGRTMMPARRDRCWSTIARIASNLSQLT